MHVGTQAKLQAVLAQGQSIWLDQLSRGLIESGELEILVDEGLRGVTSNPTIFEHAVRGTGAYETAVAALATSSKSDREVYEALVLEDIRRAADLLRPVYDRTEGGDGYVSLELDPALAHDAAGSLHEARRLWGLLDRPNVMLKVPGTTEAWPIIEELLAEGVNVNVTLLFSLEHYLRVAEAYLRALERRVTARRRINHVASVASFFVSRLDVAVERRLRGQGDELLGRVAIANARRAYARFLGILSSERWHRLAQLGAKPQRTLWASTSTKNPAYSDVLYVEGLIGPHTVSTLAPATLAAFVEHGRVARTLPESPDDVAEGQAVLRRLPALGVDLEEVTASLEAQGIRRFAESYERLLATIDAGRVDAPAAPRGPEALHALEPTVGARLRICARRHTPRRLWGRDPRVWKEDAPDIARALGWLTVGEHMAQRVPELERFAAGLRAEFDTAVLCGMGGSGLAARVLAQCIGHASGYPALHVLDSTDARALRSADELELERTLFVIASKSGTTQETWCLFRHFWERAGHNGAQFIAITDPGSALADLARARGFRALFLNPPDIGGRFSALSYFGLVPAALQGIDIRELLHRAHRMSERCSALVPPEHSPAAWLGAVLGEAARAGRDKLTVVTSPELRPLGAWVEHLVAESTGKEGRGIVPVVGEALGAPASYGDDRLFAVLTLAEESAKLRGPMEALAAARHPVVWFELDDTYDLGAEFFRWEMAVAMAGIVLRVNPFDQPNVAESKRNAREVLAGCRRVHSQLADHATVQRFLARIPPGHYLAVQAYVQPCARNDAALAALQARWRDRSRVAVTVGYGPRFLHSTGQLHKGGPPIGHFIQIVERATEDVPIPGEAYGFEDLKHAQADGDLDALARCGRPVLRVAGFEDLTFRRADVSHQAVTPNANWVILPNP
jgi:transaldolase/glucose-6-phosphate isomerase